jgi:hypothetical protein
VRVNRLTIFYDYLAPTFSKFISGKGHLKKFWGENFEKACLSCGAHSNIATKAHHLRLERD